MALAAQSPVPAAPPGEKWTAHSKTATGITGDVVFSPTRITFSDGKVLPIVPVGTIPGYETPGRKVTAKLYRVMQPVDPVLLDGNRLCGVGPVTFIVVSVIPPFVYDPELRGMDVFFERTPPDAHGGKAGPCATYYYEPAGSAGAK